MVKWFEIFKQGTMNNIRRLFELSNVDFDIQEERFEIRRDAESNETILAGGFEISFTVAHGGVDEDFKIVIIHPQERTFVFKRGGIHEPGLMEYAVTDEAAIRWVNEKIRDIERGRTEW